MKTLYKVVNRHRKSAMVSNVISKQKAPELAAYIFTYNKGVIITANPKTLGIFCFGEKDAALTFLRMNAAMRDITGKPWQIIEVEPLTQVNHCELALIVSEMHNTYIKTSRDPDDYILTPYGTVTCRKIKVLT